MTEVDWEQKFLNLREVHNKVVSSYERNLANKDKKIAELQKQLASWVDEEQAVQEFELAGSEEQQQI